MGYQRRTFRLVFEDPQFEGLEVRTRGASIEQVATWLALAGLAGDLLKPQHEPQRGELFELIAGRIIDWNLQDDDGTPVACTAAALRQEDWALVMSIGKAWISATAGVSRPLEPGSPGGPPSPEESIPMEALPASPPS